MVFVNRNRFVRTPAGLIVPRRDLLRGLGAMAAASPFAAMGCGKDEEGMSGLANGTAGTTGQTFAGTGAAGSATAGTGIRSDGVSTAGAPAAGRSAAGTGTAGTSAASGGGAGRAGMPGMTAGGTGGTGAAGMPAAGGGGTAGVAGAPAAGSGGASAIQMPEFPDSGTCMLTTTDIEGPFYIDEAEVMNDPSMIRSDVRDGHPGVEFRLYFRVMDARKSCAPIENAELYIWHCDADGYYSGFSGQDPTKPYMGSANPAPSNLDRFCRGIQTTNAMGIASFTTIYPGWYAGRPIHVHLMGRIKGQTMRLITTQLYFPADFTVDVHSTEPAYMARASMIPAGSKNPPSGRPAMPAMQHTKGLVTGTLNVIVNG